MSVFTDHEIAYLATQPLARLATASATGQPDVATVGFQLDGDTLVSGGYDISKTVRYGNLRGNPRASVVIDDLPSRDPWTPRGVKVRGSAVIEEHRTGLRIRIRPEVIWSWGINPGADGGFHGVERRKAIPG